MPCKLYYAILFREFCQEKNICNRDETLFSNIFYPQWFISADTVLTVVCCIKNFNK